jgi:caa(3)-type oxidase subunit IV
MDKRQNLWELWQTPVLTWLALMALLAATCALAYLPLGTFNLPVSLAIAALKCVLVAAIFMRLKEHRVLNRLAAFVGPVWIFIMFLLVGADYFTR